VDNIPSVFLSRILLLIIAKKYYKAVINLDVVTRYYRFVTCRYTIILMTPCVTRHYHTGWYYEYKETFRHGTNCRVKIAYCYGLRMWIFGETLWTNANGIFRSAHLC